MMDTALRAIHTTVILSSTVPIMVATIFFLLVVILDDLHGDPELDIAGNFLVGCAIITLGVVPLVTIPYLIAVWS
jgi:hypothetical protein